MDMLFWAFGTITTVTIALSLFYKPIPKSPTPASNVVAVIVSVADKKVLPALHETVDHVKLLGIKYWIVASNRTGMANSLVVPKEKDGNKFRAIKWFVENYVEENEWYVFFDDDSYPLDKEFLYEIPTAEKLGLSAANGVLVPREGKSKTCFILDWIRFFDDLTRYRVATGLLKRPLFGFHGELLIVKGAVLKEIWPRMKETVTEDFEFSQNLIKKGYRTWQSRTRVSIKSPNSKTDFINQRGRWTKGVIPSALKWGNLLVIMFCCVGIPVNILFLPFHLFFSIGLVPPALIASLYYLTVYTYGAFKARQPPYIHAFLFSPLEVVGALKALKQKGFVVIDKT